MYVLSGQPLVRAFLAASDGSPGAMGDKSTFAHSWAASTGGARNAGRASRGKLTPALVIPRYPSRNKRFLTTKAAKAGGDSRSNVPQSPFRRAARC